MANAFDQVRHSFLFKVLEQFGIDPLIIFWIKPCDGSPWIAPLVNGCPAKLFRRSRGLCQGCPLLPLLYIIMVNTLSRLLEEECIKGHILRIQIASNVKSFNHSQFIDDTLLMGGASVNMEKCFKRVLDTFCDALENLIIYAKSNLYTWNASAVEIATISRDLGFTPVLN